MLTQFHDLICGSILGPYLCISLDKIQDQAVSSFVTLIIGALYSAFGAVFSLFRPKSWRMAGLWYRYGVGFYKTSGAFPIHRARVLILPIPPLVVAFSYNKSYLYIGSISWVGGNIYIYWRGLFHSERMMSVYTEQLIVNKSTILTGVKSCITKRSEPAANKELLTKTSLGTDQITKRIGRGQFQLVIRSDHGTDAIYE